MSWLFSSLAACQALHDDAREAVEEGVRYLLERRQQDPYESFLPRAAVEWSWNWTRQAPTFVL